MSDDAVVKPEEIRAVRRSLGYSQTEFGALFRVSQPAVAGWERGTKKPQGRRAQRLAELTREYLRDGTPVFTPVNLVALRRHLNETQRDFGKHFGSLVTLKTAILQSSFVTPTQDFDSFPNLLRN